MRKPILIVRTGDLPGSMAHLGSFERQFQLMADYGEAGTAVVDAVRDPLPEPTAFACLIVTGSLAMVSDREPWSERCAIWLKGAIEVGVRVLGVCYGHQLVAHALGGLVGYNPKGRTFGSHELNLTPAGLEHPLLRGLPATFKTNQANSQVVLDAPRGAAVLGTSPYDRNAVLAYGPQVLTVQFHPEFSGDVTREFVDLATDGGRKMDGSIRLAEPIQDTPEAASLLQRFVDEALRHNPIKIPGGKVLR